MFLQIKNIQNKVYSPLSLYNKNNKNSLGFWLLSNHVCIDILSNMSVAHLSYNIYPSPAATLRKNIKEPYVWG